MTALESYEFCQSMFPLEGEFVATAETSEWLEKGRPGTIDAISFDLYVEATPAQKVQIHVTLPTEDGKPGRYALQRCLWLTRAAYTQLEEAFNTRLAELEGEASQVVILEAAELVRSYDYDSLVEKNTEAPPTADSPELVRIWFWFPSLSTREKRADMVKWAPNYGLTGFVMAGKPGVLCVEGASANIGAYMGEIKAVSWADIPSFQKKVTERFREPIESRIFDSMEEITRLVDRTGHRGNHAEMAQVKTFLEGKGLGEAFGLVIGGGQFT